MNVCRSSAHLYIICWLVSVVSVPALAQETAPSQEGAPSQGGTAHPEVVWATQYQLPGHSCRIPTLRNSNQPNQIEKFERKSRRYVKCVTTYQAAIIEDHQRIVSAADHGITQQQAQIMVEKLRAIEEMVVALGEGVNIELDPLDVERLLSQGNRPSI